MQLPTLLALSLLEAAVLVSASPDSPADGQSHNGPERRNVLARTTSLKCNADNCYRVMTNTLSVATPFCSTFLQSTTTTTIQPVITISGTVTVSPTITANPIPSQSFPTHLTSQCELTSAPPLLTRLSSACSCLPTPVVPVTVTSTVLLPATTSIVPSGECAALTSPLVTESGPSFGLFCGGPYDGDCLDPEVFGGSCWGQGLSYEACVELCGTISDCVGIWWSPDFFGSVSGDLNAGCAPISSIFTGYVYGGGDAEDGFDYQGAVRTDQCLYDAGAAFLANC